MLPTETQYSIEEIEQWVTTQLSALAPVRKPRKGAASSTPENDERKAPNFAAVVAACAWVQERNESDHIPEPEWYALAGIVGQCGDGEKIFHEISSRDARYDPAQTSAKLAHAIESAKPRTCANIEEQLGAEACKTCPLRGKITSPIELGYVGVGFAELVRNNAFVVDRRQYLDLTTGAMLLVPSFSDKYRHLTGDVTPHYRMTSARITRKVDSIDYRPGVRDLFIEEKGRSAFNSWKEGGIKPVQGDCATILSHLDSLIPDAVFREHFLNCLSVLFQKPGEKVKHVPLITGAQGTGKSLFFTLLRNLVGEGNYATIESDHLASRWTAGMGNVQLLVLEEMKTFDQMEVYNRFKPWITDRTVRAEEKHIPIYTARTPDLIIGATNHESPINLEQGDRRFALYKSPMSPQARDYYALLAAAIVGEASAFLHYLMQRDISTFNPSAPPPMTDAKAELISWSLPLVTQEIVHMSEDGIHPFWSDLISVDELRQLLGERLRKQPSRHDVVRGLKHIGAASLKPLRVGTGTTRLWAWRNAEQWSEAEPQKLREHYVDWRKQLENMQARAD